MVNGMKGKRLFESLWNRTTTFSDLQLFFHSSLTEAAESSFFLFPQCSNDQGIAAQGLLCGDKLNDKDNHLKSKLELFFAQVTHPFVICFYF